jgi:hypothetical protein
VVLPRHPAAIAPATSINEGSCRVIEGGAWRVEVNNCEIEEAGPPVGDLRPHIIFNSYSYKKLTPIAFKIP